MRATDARTMSGPEIAILRVVAAPMLLAAALVMSLAVAPNPWASGVVWLGGGALAGYVLGGAGSGRWVSAVGLLLPLLAAVAVFMLGAMFMGDTQEGVDALLAVSSTIFVVLEAGCVLGLVAARRAGSRNPFAGRALGMQATTTPTSPVLEALTARWTALSIVRRYSDDFSGRARLEEESRTLAEHGYGITHTTSDQPPGWRIAAEAVLSLALGGDGVEAGHRIVTWSRRDVGGHLPPASEATTPRHAA